MENSHLCDVAKMLCQVPQHYWKLTARVSGPAYTKLAWVVPTIWGWEISLTLGG